MVTPRLPALFAAVVLSTTLAHAQPPGPGRGFPAPCPWVSFYGSARQMGNLARVAKTFRIINLDADPQAGNFNKAQIATLKARGKNRVLSYLNVGACERYRDYYSKAPKGYLSCRDNRKAHKGIYRDYPDEMWMDPANPDYQRLLIDVVAPRLVAMGVDGFYLDNLEILEHGAANREAPCDTACRQGGLAFVAKLRRAFPKHLLVLQNATSDPIRQARLADGTPFASLLDGVAREETYTPTKEPAVEADLLSWQGMKLTPGGRPFFIGTLDFVGDCRARRKARAVAKIAKRKGFCPFVTDTSAGQKVICEFR